jgi:hypothetical protein
MRPRSTTSGSADVESLEVLVPAHGSHHKHSIHGGHNNNDLLSHLPLLPEGRKKSSSSSVAKASLSSSSSSNTGHGFHPMEYCSKKIWNMFASLKKNVKSELSKGLDPHILAMSVATGVTCGLWPIYFTTTVICGVVDIIARMIGHPLSTVIIQSVNMMMGPLEFMLAIPFLHLGEKLFSDTRTPLSPSEFAVMLKTDPWHLKHILTFSILGWLFCVPFAFGIVYFLCRRYMTKIIQYLVGPIERSSF